ncbi:MAG: ArsR family transcriptional regulator [Euryarchaeota archaeon]|nr:ArsR family transcriptional regulator [Euryarchaeota archaeon]
MRTHWIWPLLVGLLLVPTANAGSTLEDESVLAGPDFVELEVSEVADGAEGASWYNRMDLDGDGTATEQETSKWSLAWKLDAADVPSCFVGFSYATLGGDAPIGFASVRRSALTWEKDGAHAVGLLTVVRLQYAATSGDEYNAALHLWERDQVESAYRCVTGRGHRLFEHEGPPTVILDVWTPPGVEIAKRSVHPSEFRDNYCDCSSTVVYADACNTTTGECTHSDREPETTFYTVLQFRRDGIAKAYTNEIRFHVGPASTDWSAILLATTGLGALGVAARVTFSDWGRFKFLPFVPFFTRITKAKALEHDLRDALNTYVAENPGASFGEMRRHFSVGHGTLIHHLRVLKEQGFVSMRRDKLKARFYKVGFPLPSTPTLSDEQAQLLRLVQGEPGLRQVDLAGRVGLARENVKYHLGVLAEAGLVRVAPDGRARRYYPSGAS